MIVKKDSCANLTKIMRIRFPVVFLYFFDDNKNRRQLLLISLHPMQ